MTTYSMIYQILTAAVLYYICPMRWRWGVLLVYSFSLYASGGGQAMCYMGFAILSTYAAALLIQRMTQRSRACLEAQKAWSRDEKKAEKARTRRRQKYILTVALVANFGMLCVLKYVPWLPSSAMKGVFSLAGRQAPSFRLFAPLGISFFVFQSTGYLMDVYNGKYPAERNLLKYALFISFFPQLIQGPIGRYDALAPQLTTPHRLEIANIRSGLMLMLWGFFKKKVIADLSWPLIDQVFANQAQYGGSVIVVAVLMYALQQYTDFSGGIDLVTGGAQLMGIGLAPNFRRPYFSVSLGDFWRRWHISLGSWMRDYVFYPFALTKTMQRMSRAAKKTVGADVARALPAALGNILVFLLVGLWHGATGNYVAWGLYNGVILAFSALVEPVYKRFGERHAALVQSRGFYVFRILRTFVIVNIGWYFDRALSLGDALSMLGKTLFMPVPGQLWDGTLLTLGISGQQYLVLLGAVCILFAVSVMQERGICMREWVMERPLALRWGLLYMLMLYTMLFYASDAVTGFIYAAF